MAAAANVFGEQPRLGTHHCRRRLPRRHPRSRQPARQGLLPTRPTQAPDGQARPRYGVRARPAVRQGQLHHHHGRRLQPPPQVHPADDRAAEGAGLRHRHGHAVRQRRRRLRLGPEAEADQQGGQHLCRHGAAPGRERPHGQLPAVQAGGAGEALRDHRRARVQHADGAGGDGQGDGDDNRRSSHNLRRSRLWRFEVRRLGNCRVCEGCDLFVGESLGLEFDREVEQTFLRTPVVVLEAGFLHLELGHHIHQDYHKGCTKQFSDPNAPK